MKWELKRQEALLLQRNRATRYVSWNIRPGPLAVFWLSYWQEALLIQRNHASTLSVEIVQTAAQMFDGLHVTTSATGEWPSRSFKVTAVATKSRQFSVYSIYLRLNSFVESSISRQDKAAKKLNIGYSVWKFCVLTKLTLSPIQFIPPTPTRQSCLVLSESAAWKATIFIGTR